MDDSNPLTALLAQHKGDNTVLDKHFEKAIAPKLKEIKEENSEDEQPITLNCRQPSFSSLHHGELIVKGGKMVSDLEEVDEDPVIVVSEDPEETAIGLQYRQPSFSSLDANHCVLKGCGSLRDIKPVLTIPIEEVAGDDEEAIQKDLEMRNSQRWKEMGYEPTMEAKPVVESVIEPIAPLENPRPAVPTRHRRCGSDGMKLGEASTSLARMSQALMLPKDTSREMIETVEDVEEISEEEMEAEEELEATEELGDGDLYGRLSLIVKEGRNSLLYRLIETGDVNLVHIEEVDEIGEILNEYREICIQRLWIDELSYLNSIIDALSSPTPVQTTVAESDSKYDKKIERTKLKFELALELLDEEYRDAALDLDIRFTSGDMVEKYSRPSELLMQMRERCKNLLQMNMFEEAKRESIKVKAREDKEAKERSAELQARYIKEDRRLKEDFAVKRDLIRRKYTHQIEQLEARKQEAAKRHGAAVVRTLEALPYSDDACMLKVSLPKRIPRA